MRVFDYAIAVDPEKGFRDPKCLAKALLARTVGHLEGIKLLLRAGMIAEARTLTRCCYENLFWTSALAERGDEFAGKMCTDHTTHTKKEGRRFLDWCAQQEKEFDFNGTLKSDLEKLESVKDERVVHANAAVAGKMENAYLLYQRLSSDSAHPSMESLCRNVQGDVTSGFTFFARGLAGKSEDYQTLGMACAALLGVAVSASRVQNGPLSNDDIEKMVAADDAFHQKFYMMIAAMFCAGVEGHHDDTTWR